MSDRAYDPDYLEDLLLSIGDERKDKERRRREHHEDDQGPPVQLNDYALKVWNGQHPVLDEDEEVDRSGTLYKIGAVLFEAEATRKTIIEALKERDVALGWEKYSNRKDPGKEYERIVDKLEEKARNTDNVYDFDEHKKERNQHSSEESSFGTRVLLGEAAKKGVKPPKELVEDVLLEGEVHQVFSGAGTGKTFVSLYVAAKGVEQGRPIVYLDRENGQRIIVERLIEGFGVDPEKADELIHYYPDPEMDLSTRTKESLLRMLDEVNPSLVVFDSMIDYIAYAGLDDNVPTSIST